MEAETASFVNRSRDVGERMMALLNNDGPAAMAAAALALQPADIAHALDDLESDQQLRVFLALHADHAADVLEEASPELRDTILEQASDAKLLQILRDADTDDAVYFLDHLDSDRAEHLLGQLDTELRDQLSLQFDLPEDAAGRMMTSELMALQPFMTASKAIDKIRTKPDLKVPALYVTTVSGKLVGTVSFRQLVFSPPQTTIDSLMNRDVIYTTVDQDQEDAVALMQRYELYALPVVDDNEMLRGMITLDDAFDVMEAEADEDILAVAGTSENLDDNDGVIGRAMKRFPYLLLTVIGGFFIATMIEGQSEAIHEYTMLVAFLPLVPALAGTIGIQCSTVTLKYIIGDEATAGTVRSRIVKELLTGGFLAIVMSAVALIGALGLIFWNNDQLFLAWVISIAMLFAIIFAAINGVLIPLTCTRLKIDPAIAAGPFIVMLCDIGGIAIYPF